MSTASDMLAIALGYARRGWRVHPLYEPVDEGGQYLACACGDPHDGSGKFDENGIGKHPRLKGWQEVATTDEARICEWWTAWPNANIGIATGKESGLYVFDEDGVEGREALAALAPDLAPTPTVLTGKGRHLYLAHPGVELRNRGKLAPMLDTRGDGGFVVAAGSLHRLGHRYTWTKGTENLAPAAMPLALFSAAQNASISSDGLTIPKGRAAEIPLADIPKGNRHDTLKSYVGRCVGLGMSAAETFEHIRAINQTRCRPPLPEDELRDMIVWTDAKERTKPPRERAFREEAPIASRAVLIQMSTIEPKETQWVWRNRIPLGNYSLFDGEPGLGKSQLLLDVAARVTRGWSMPDGTPGVQGRVIILTAEDDLAATIRPRLEAAGADLTLVHEMRIEYPDGKRYPPSFPDNVLQLRDVVQEYGDVKIVVIDPVTAFLSGEINSHKEQDVRRVFHLLKEAAEEHAFALSGVRHLNKNKGGSAINRGGGSIGFVAGARASSLVSRHPEDPARRVLACVKNNLGPEPSSLTFHLEEARIGAGWSVSRIRYDGTTTLTANELIAAMDEDAGARTERKEAKDWLADYLGDHEPHGAETLFADGDKVGHKRRTLQRALAELHARRTRPKVPGPWYYTLDAPILASPHKYENVASMQSMASMDEDAA